MLVFLNESFMNKRPNLKKGIIDLIQRTVTQVQGNTHPGIPGDEDVVLLVDGLPTADGRNFKWEDYKDKHRVAIKFVGDEKPNKQWYRNEHGVVIIECFSPSKVINWAEGYPEFFYAFEKGLNFKYYERLAKQAEKIDYHVLKSFDEPEWEQLRTYKGLLGSDIETRGFNFREDKIMVSGFCTVDENRNRKVIIVPQTVVESSEENRRQFKAFLENVKISFCWQNGKFDTKFFRHLGIDARVDEDIMLMQYAQDERGKGILGLEHQATKVLNADSYKHQIDFATVDPQDPKLHYYLAQDCIYTQLLYEHHWMMLHKKGAEHSYKLYKNILLKASWALTRLEENGFYVNRPYALQLEKDFRIKLEKAESALNGIAIQAGYTPQSFVDWSGQKKLPDKFSSNAPKQLAYVLIHLLGLPKFKNTNTTNIKAMLHWLFDILDFPNKDSDAFLDTNTDVVNEWLVNDPRHLLQKRFLWNLLNYRKLKKMYSTYILNAVKYSAKDGRVHATFKIHGTVTGRLSSGDPMNLQNIPRRKDIKNMFKAPKGKTLMECDYSQCIRKGTPVYGGDLLIEDHADAAYKGKSPIFRVGTKRGYGVECTEDHRIFTQRGWVEAKDLRGGDFIALAGQTVDNTAPDPFAVFVGFFAGDGTFQNNSISVARGEDKYLQDTLKLIEDAGLVHKSKSKNAIYVSTTPELRDTLQNLVNKKDLRVPRTSDVNFLAGYLRGLFEADGSADKDGIYLASKYINFVRDVQRVLLQFGVMSTIIESTGGYNLCPDGRTIFKLAISDMCSIRNFVNYIGFRSKIKRGISEAINKSRSAGNYLPTLTVEEVKNLHAGKDNKFYRQHILNYKNGRMYTRESVRDLNISEEHTRYHWDVFKEFEDLNIMDDVYDLLDQPETRFVANGVIVHNCELRILAYLSQDPDMIKTYVDDGDLHDAVAIKMFGPDFTKEQRVGAKTVNFGLAYGRGKASVAEQLRCSLQFASDLVDQWHESMPVASKFITKTRAKPRRGEKCTTPLGRERRFWLLNHKNENTCENEAINFPIQATASDCTLISLYRFLHILEEDPVKWAGVFPVNIVHDAILVEAPDVMVDETAQLLMKCMCETPKTLMPDLNVPLKADAEVTKIGWGKKSDWSPGCVPSLPLE